MHGTFRSELGEGPVFWQSPIEFPRSFVPTPATPVERSAYGARRPNWPLIAIILAAHVALLTALILFDVIPMPRPKSEPLVVTLIKLPVEPPPQRPSAKPAPAAEPVKPQLTAPEQLVRTETPAMPVVVQIAAPPVPVAAPTPAPTGPVTIGDLGAKMIAMTPPRYPMESRRRKEQGTVILSVLLGTDGSVAEIQLASSSGFDRLDKAALDAVRKWRWSPVVRAGAPVMVRGTVDIPFILKA